MRARPGGSLRSVGAISHYDVLGVAPTAGEAEIRDAYRRLARERHPDRTGGDDAPMAALNDAYQVLGDPVRRAEYDAGLRRSSSAAGSAVPPAAVRPSEPVGAGRPPTGRLVSGPVRFPWKLSLVMAAIGATGVLAVAAFYRPAGPPPPDGLLETGSCVVLVDADHTAREVACDAAARYRVRALVPLDDGCPSGSVGYREVDGLRTACVELVLDE